MVTIKFKNCIKINAILKLVDTVYDSQDNIQISIKCNYKLHNRKNNNKSGDTF